MKIIQILGLFNSGTNLVYSILNELFDVHVGKEGHTLFWKHTVIGKNFAKKYATDDVYYIVVTKNPYFQFHSFKKSPYSIKLKNYHNYDQLSLDTFVEKPFFIMLPSKTLSDMTTLNYKNCPHYWNKFHTSAFKHLPPNKTIIIRYEDILFNSKKIIYELCKFFPLKQQYQLDPIVLQNSLNNILNRPSKSSGKPRFGASAKQFYSSDYKTLYKPKTIEWLRSELNKDIMEILRYQ